MDPEPLVGKQSEPECIYKPTQLRVIDDDTTLLPDRAQEIPFKTYVYAAMIAQQLEKPKG